MISSMSVCNGQNISSPFIFNDFIITIYIIYVCKHEIKIDLKVLLIDLNLLFGFNKHNIATNNIKKLFHNIRK